MKKIKALIGMAVATAVIASACGNSPAGSFDMNVWNGNGAEESSEEALYLDNVKTICQTMQKGVTDAETAYSKIDEVFYNASNQINDPNTDRYTCPDGNFSMNPDVAVGNLLSDAEFEPIMEDIRENEASVKRYMDELQEPPEECFEVYDMVYDLYDAYTGTITTILNPTRSSVDFLESSFTHIDEGFKKSYDEIYQYIAETDPTSHSSFGEEQAYLGECSFFNNLTEKEQNVRGFYRHIETDSDIYYYATVVEIEPIGNNKAVEIVYRETFIGALESHLGAAEIPDAGEVDTWCIVDIDEIDVNENVYTSSEGTEYTRIDPRELKGQQISNMISTDYYSPYFGGNLAPVGFETCTVDYDKINLEEAKEGTGMVDADFSYTVSDNRRIFWDTAIFGHVVVSDTKSDLPEDDIWIVTDEQILHIFKDIPVMYYSFAYFWSWDWAHFPDEAAQVGTSSHIVKGDDDALISGEARGSEWGAGVCRLVAGSFC